MQFSYASSPETVNRYTFQPYIITACSESNLAKLSRNLDEIEEYINHKNELITDDARLFRVALVIDLRSPKLYFLPNLDTIRFDTEVIEESRRLAGQFREGENRRGFSDISPTNSSRALTISISSHPSPTENHLWGSGKLTPLS
jgi:hypothetical protein